MQVEDENAREFYMQEAVKSQWSTRRLGRQINFFFCESDLGQALITHLQKFFWNLAEDFHLLQDRKE